MKVNTHLRKRTRYNNIVSENAITRAAPPRRFIFVIPLLAYLLSNCGIFDLRDPDAPTDGFFVGDGDPLNISVILHVADRNTVYMNYNDYFTANVAFEDYRGMAPMRGREDVVRMLDRLRIQATHVEWNIDMADRRFEGNRWTINNAPYIVYSGGHELCRGLADFELIKEPDWRINSWRDTPAAGYPPFFERWN